MSRKYTRQKNMKFKKKAKGLNWIVNTFLAGALTGAITLGVMQGLKREPVKNNFDLQTKIMNAIDVNDFNDVNRNLNYKTENFQDDSDKVLLARMIYGETRNCSDEEKIAVAYSVINRVNDGKKWNGESVREVILKPWQYSCFNKNDVNREKLKNPDKRIFSKCLEIAEDVLAGKYNEFNFGQTHYFNPDVVRPDWAEKLDRVGNIKDSKHEFYVER